MISLLLFGFVLLLVIFTFVLFFGAPYLPTRKEQVKDTLDLLNLKQGQLLIEFGSGDGRVLKAAAKRNIKAHGYEMNPILVLISKISNFKHKSLVTTTWGNMWKADLSEADGIYTFLLDRYMDKFDQKLKNEAKSGAKVVSFAFKIPGKKMAKRKKGLFLYIYR